MLQTDQQYPSVGSQTKGLPLRYSADDPDRSYYVSDRINFLHSGEIVLDAPPLRQARNK